MPFIVPDKVDNKYCLILPMLEIIIMPNYPYIMLNKMNINYHLMLSKLELTIITNIMCMILVCTFMKENFAPVDHAFSVITSMSLPNFKQGSIFPVI